MVLRGKTEEQGPVVNTTSTVTAKLLMVTQTSTWGHLLQYRFVFSALLILVLVVLNTTCLQAQPSNPGSPVPIDGGLGLLAAGGAALAYRKYRRRQK